MTEADWLSLPGPYLMLESLRGKASDRRLRLFGCACCRRIWDLIYDERSRVAVEGAEKFSDGLVGRRDLNKNCSTARAATEAARAQLESWNAQGVFPYQTALVGEAERVASFHAALAAAWVCCRDPNDCWQVSTEAAKAVRAATYAPGRQEETSVSEVREDQAELLRDIFGNPFRPVTTETTWLRWRDQTIPGLARSIYNERCFEDLPILADALEDAGYNNRDILSHCRGPGPHVLGCWVVDLLLGKS
jgi:hypothetical protein